MSASKRIPRDYKEMLGFRTKEIPGVVMPMPMTVEGFYARPKSPHDIFNWEGWIEGPEGTPYEGGFFLLDIIFPPNYPFSPPKIQFKTRIYHCNVNSEGGICLDILKNAWSPILSISKILLSLSSLLADCNPKDPLVPDIAHKYNSNRAQHDATAREWTKLYATLPKRQAGDKPNPNPNPLPAGATAATTTSTTTKDRLAK